MITPDFSGCFSAVTNPDFCSMMDVQFISMKKFVCFN